MPLQDDLIPPGDGAPPATAAPQPRMFDKPGVVLRDPDPYAFAHRIGRLTLVLVALVVVVAGPYLVQQYAYHARYGRMRADLDAADVGLASLKPRLEDFSLASRLVAKKVEPSVVSIHRPGFRGFEGQGSGVIMDSQGYVVTNYHVVEGAMALEVRLDDGRREGATIIGADPATDLAVLKIDATNLVAATWGDSDDLEVGDLVWALGSPFGLERSMTFGIVSAKSRRSESGVSRSIYQEYLQTDVAINPGNSGGPLVTMDGKVVGINAAILGDSYRGVSFAIPSAVAQEKYLELRDRGFIERGYLGVQPMLVPDVVRRAMGLSAGEGVFINRVVTPGPASEAGIEAGDVILKWNAVDAIDPTLLSRAIAGTKIGSTAEVRIKRLVRNRPTDMTLSVQVGRSPTSGRPE